MKHWFQKISFRNKLLTTNFSLLFIALIITFVFYFNSITSAMEFNMSYIHQFNEQVNLTLDMALETDAAPNLLHFVDNDVKIKLRKNIDQFGGTAKYDFEQKITKYLKMIALSRTNTLRCTIVTRNGDIYSSYENEMVDYIEYMNVTNEQLTWARRMEPFYSKVHSEMINGSSQLLLTAVYQMYDIGAKEGFAYLYVDMDFSEIVKTLNTRSDVPESITSLALISGDEVIYNSKDSRINITSDLSHEERDELLGSLESGKGFDSQDRDIKLNGITCIASAIQNQNTGWYILQYIPKNSLLLYSMKNSIGIGILLVILYVVGILLSVMLSNYVSRPIKELADIMSKAKVGKVEPYKEPHVIWQDEVGKLIQSYNDMGERINDSINRIYIYQINQKQTELKMLQMQINPHFLYNVLHMISSIAKLEGVKEISEIAERLSDMFRYSIKGSEFVSLADELSQVQNYIYIQSMRFPNRFEVHYEIDEQAQHRIVLKFILQPIVENAVEHGFCDNIAGKNLYIRARLENSDILIVEIEDDGVGIDTERMDDINQKLENAKADLLISDTEEGIGLTNVNARLKNHYGETCGIRIARSHQGNTCVTLKLRPEDNEREG